MIRVAVDAMGGDNAPVEMVAGAVEAVKKKPEIQKLYDCLLYTSPSPRD